MQLKYAIFYINMITVVVPLLFDIIQQLQWICEDHAKVNFESG